MLVKHGKGREGKKEKGQENLMLVQRHKLAHFISADY